MKKSILIIAFLLIGFFGFGQNPNERPYVIKYKTQSDTIYYRTQSIGGIHIDAQGQELLHENGTEWSSLTDMDTVYIYRGSEIVNPMYVPIDWDDATLLSSNDSIGNYQIQFNGEIPELQPGSIITIDQDTVVHHVFVETVDVNGNTVSLTSTEAYLTDIFADTDFTLTTVEGKSSAQGNVFYPVAAYQLNDNGVCVPLDLNALRGGGWGFTHDLWQYGANFNGEELFSGSHYTVYMERMNFIFDLDLDLYMNFSGRNVHEIVGNAIDRWRSRTLDVNASLLGTFDTEQRIRCDVEGSFNYNPGYDIWKHNFFRPLTVRFVVYGVPIVITLNSDLYRQVQLTGSGEISAYTGFADNADGRMGFEWNQRSGIEPVYEFSNTFEFTPPTLEGHGSIRGQVWAFPRIRLIVEYTLGPSFDFKPYLSDSVSGGFREELLGQSNDFCAWSLDCNTGLDVACGLSIQHPMFAYEVQNYSLLDRNIIDRPLYHSPKRIYRASVGSGPTKTVSFNVYDQNHLFNTEVLTPLPQFVKFEAEGELSSEYGIAYDGQVTVDWTPSDNDILYAKLYDVDGNVMAWDTVHAQEDSIWVDLGLPSGLLWATRNIGASSPEDYGDYFAWGETQPKSVYNWDTYIYGYIDNDGNVHLIKYNTTDNLTILQQGDDSATVNWGSGARTPTSGEWYELYNCCTSVWTTHNGVSGRCFTGPNGNSIFLPAAGGYNDDNPTWTGSNGFYWSSSLVVDNPIHVYYFNFGSDYNIISSQGSRFCGSTVRPVCYVR